MPIDSRMCKHSIEYSQSEKPQSIENKLQPFNIMNASHGPIVEGKKTETEKLRVV